MDSKLRAAAASKGFRVNGKTYADYETACAAAIANDDAEIQIWDPATRNWREFCACEINEDEN